MSTPQLPNNPLVEKHVLSACLKDSGQTYQRAKDAGVTTASFYDPRNAIIWDTLATLPSPALDLLFPAIPQDRIPPAYLLEVDNTAKTTAFVGDMLKTLNELTQKRQIIRNATAVIEHAKNGSTIDELHEQVKEIAPPAPATIINRASRRVRFTAPPPEPTTRLFLAGKPIATPGNLTTIISRAKTGKTATLGAAVAAIIAAHNDRSDRDTLKFTAPHNKEAVVLIDTEQSPYDAWTCHSRVLSRADSPDPDWLHHHAMVGLTPKQLRQELPIILSDAAQAHGGIFTIILDGVADFVSSVNDEAETKDFIAWLRSLTVQYNCPCICVIHSNEGVKNGDDGRGHLGKELTRKSESNLLLKKVGDVTTITSDKQRKAPITEADGVAFQWDDALQRHVTCGTVSQTPKAGRKPKYDPDLMLTGVPGPNDTPKPVNQIHRDVEGLPCGIDIRTFKDWMAKWVQTGEVIRTGDVKSGFVFRRSF